MDTLVWPLAGLSSLGLAGVALSLLAVFQVRSVARALERRTQAGHDLLAAALDATRKSLDSVAAEVRDIQAQPPAAVMPAMPRSGLNLTKRSQALRMHRRGVSPSQIATALDLPLQEIDLLLKVHRIVLSNLGVTPKMDSTPKGLG